MPDHAHAVFRIIDQSRLGQVLQSIKGFSSREIGRRLGPRGPCWLDESFDRVVRDQAEWEEKLGYIRQNPVKAGLVAAPELYKWTYVKGITG